MIDHNRNIVPSEILNACSKNMAFREKIRITHQKRLDGSNCSIGKDAACSITKWNAGWTWFCFRCGESGVVPLGVRTPSETLIALKTDGFNPKIKEAPLQIKLPLDFISMKEDNFEKIPNEAYAWLYKYNVGDNLISKYHIGWSDAYKRVIIPLYEYDMVGSILCRKIIGWVGRDVFCASKAQREKLGVRKYLIKKNPDIKHPLFHATEHFFEKKFSNTAVIVEDILSAIRINDATGCETFALLNTFVPPSLPRQKRDKFILLWLDDGQGSNMFNLVKKYAGYGLDISCIWTNHDPKALSDKQLRRNIARKISDHAFNKAFGT